jgi:hypothetical protein
MDPYGNIYDIEEMKEKFETEENKEQLEMLIKEDTERLRNELKQAETEVEMRRRLRAPFKK